MSIGHEHEESTDVVMQDARETTLRPELGVLGHGSTWTAGVFSSRAVSQFTRDWSQRSFDECEVRVRAAACMWQVSRGLRTELGQLTPMTSNRNPLTTAATSATPLSGKWERPRDCPCWLHLVLTRRDTACGVVWINYTYVLVSARISERDMQGRPVDPPGAHVPRPTR